jgi:glycosyl transferase family 87
MAALRPRVLVGYTRSNPLTVMAAVVPGLIALGICSYQLVLPNVLFGVNGYDDGVYFGAAVRLVHGVLPYRDFVFEHPPGIALLMAPIAAIGREIGTRDAMAVARCVTAVVAGLNATMAAIALRHRGLAAMLGAGLALALFPEAVGGDSTVLLEPYVVCFCLLGVVIAFEDGSLANRRRLFISGLAFGFAGAVKVWAIFPVIAMLVCMLPRWKDCVRPFATGLLLGFGIPSLPFFFLAPHSFVHDVVVAQLSRGTSGVDAFSVSHRLLLITGLYGLLGDQATPGLVTGVTIGSAVIAVAIYAIAARRMTRMEWFVLGAAGWVLLGLLLLSPLFVEPYAYFSAAFLALLVGVCLGSISRVISRISGAAAVPVAILSIALLALVIQRDLSYARSDLSGKTDPGEAVAATIPEGTCVIFDTPTVLIIANRYVPARQGCPDLVDPFGVWLASDPAHPPPFYGPYSPEFLKMWRAWFERADYVVQVAPQSNFFPWPTDRLSWFNANYRLVFSQPGVYVYAHYAEARGTT